MLLIGKPSISMGHLYHGYVKWPEGNYGRLWYHGYVNIYTINYSETIYTMAMLISINGFTIVYGRYN